MREFEIVSLKYGFSSWHFFTTSLGFRSLDLQMECRAGSFLMAPVSYHQGRASYTRCKGLRGRRPLASLYSTVGSQRVDTLPPVAAVKWNDWGFSIRLRGIWTEYKL